MGELARGFHPGWISAPLPASAVTAGSASQSFASEEVKERSLTTCFQVAFFPMACQHLNRSFDVSRDMALYSPKRVKPSSLSEDLVLVDFPKKIHPYPIWLSVSRVSFPKDNPPFGFNRLVGASLQKTREFFSVQHSTMPFRGKVGPKACHPPIRQFTQYLGHL
tara:strand:- start:499 stop:990 length:492 start_codon:yes stop_codon:yes gene_type:complete